MPTVVWNRSQQNCAGKPSSSRQDGCARWYDQANYTPAIALRVDVPADKHRWFTAIFYVVWSGNATARLGTNGLPILPLQPVKTFLSEAAQVVAAFEYSGLALAGVEGLLAIKDVVLAGMDKRNATKQIAKYHQAHEKAIANLVLYRRTQQQKNQARLLAEQAAADRIKQAASQQLDLEQGDGPADAAGPALANAHPSGANPGQRDGLQRLAQQVAANPNAEQPVLHDQPNIMAEQHVVVPDARALDREACDGYLLHTDARRRHSNATTGVWASIIACVRDFGVQGGRVTLDVLKKAGQVVFPQVLGHLLPWLFSIGMGVFHSVAAWYELRKANRNRALAEQVMAQTRQNRSAVEADRKRADRITTPLTAAALEQFDTNIKTARKQAKLQRKWAFARFAYGAFSILSGAGTIALGLLVTGAMLTGIGAAIVGAVAIAAGVGWLGFAVYKNVKRIRLEQVERYERQELRAALDALDERDEMKDKSLEQCTAGDLARLISDRPALQVNRYILAARLAKDLLIVGGGDQNPHVKVARLNVSTTLQTMGMPKETTTMLKHASFEQAHEAIYRYLRADTAQHLMQTGSFRSAKASAATA